jgi:hypothetical protein
MASTGDKITDTRNAARPNSARVTSGRSAAGATLACDNLAGWPTASKVHFVTYTVDSNSNPVAGSQLDCYGIVSGNNVNSFTVVDGSDTGNSVGDYVEMLPTAAWGQDLADALTAQHTRTGAHSGITNTGGLTTDTLAATGNSTVGGTLGVTGVLTPSGGLSSGSVSGAALATSAITLGYAQITSSVSGISTIAQVTGLTATVTIPAGGRSIEITAYTPAFVGSGANTVGQFNIWDGVVNVGTKLNDSTVIVTNAGFGNYAIVKAIVTPAAGSKTYNIGASITSGTATITAAATTPAFISVKAI